MAGQYLKYSQSFTYLGMLLHEDRKIKHAVQARFSKACASLGSIFSRYYNLQCATAVQLLVKLQQAILQPCALYGCEVWAPAHEATGPFREVQTLQQSLLRRACRVKSSVPIEIVFEELSRTWWHGSWWRWVLSYRNAMAQADSAIMGNIVLHYAPLLSLRMCAALAGLPRFKDALLSMANPACMGMANAPVEVQPDKLLLAFKMQQAPFETVPLDPWSCPGLRKILCTYCCWFSRPADQICPAHWGVPTSTAALQRILGFRRGFHLLPSEPGCHLCLPCQRRVCRLCHSEALAMWGTCSLCVLLWQMSVGLYIEPMRSCTELCYHASQKLAKLLRF